MHCQEGVRNLALQLGDEGFLRHPLQTLAGFLFVDADTSNVRDEKPEPATIPRFTSGMSAKGQRTLRVQCLPTMTSVMGRQGIFVPTPRCNHIRIPIYTHTKTITHAKINVYINTYKQHSTHTHKHTHTHTHT